MRTTLLFLLLTVAGTFCTALLLVVYESTKPGGYRGVKEKPLVWFSVVTGLILAAIALRLLPSRGLFL